MARPHALSPQGDGPLFDATPITLAGFTLHGRGVKPVGRPTDKQWVAAAQFAAGAEESSPYWIGDLLLYAENRADWREKLEQMISLTGLAAGTLKNHTVVARHVELPERKLAPSFTHAREVASLPRPEQTKVLTNAKLGGWTVQQTIRAVRQVKRPLVLKGQAELEGQFRVIVAAPDWRRMSIDAIAALPVPAHAQADAVLLLWVPPRLLLANPGPRDVLDTWGFTYATQAVWDRVIEGSPGRFLSVTHENLILATRGRIESDVGDFRPRSVYNERRTLEERSDRPQEILRWVEKLFTTGPYLQLFGTTPRPGWSTFGSDPSQWAKQARAEVA